MENQSPENRGDLPPPPRPNPGDLEANRDESPANVKSHVVPRSNNGTSEGSEEVNPVDSDTTDTYEASGVSTQINLAKRPAKIVKENPKSNTKGQKRKGASPTGKTPPRKQSNERLNLNKLISELIMMVAKNYKIRTQRILEKIYTTYILPQINYCSSQWNTNVEAHMRGIESGLSKFWKMSQTRLRPSKIMGFREQLIYNDLKQLHKIKHGKSTIEFDDLFKISDHQKKTNEEINPKKFKRKFAQHSFGRRVQKYWNLLPLEVREMKRERFKSDIKILMTAEKKARKRQILLNYGLAMPITLAPPGINE